MNPVSQPKSPRRTTGTPVNGPRRARRLAVVLSAAGMATAGTLLWGGFATIDTVQARTSAAPASAAPAARPAPAAVVQEALPVRAPAHSGAHGTSPDEAAAKNAPAAPVRSEPGAPSPAGNQAAPSAGKNPGAGRPGEKLTPQDPSEQKSVPGTRKEKSLAEAGSEASRGQLGARPSGAGNRPDRSAGLAPRGPIDPKAVTGGGETALGGCLVEYGADGQCLPVVPPSMAEHAKQMKDSGVDPLSMPHTWSCEEVREFFPDGLPVRQAAVDPQELDTNEDATACGVGD